MKNKIKLSLLLSTVIGSLLVSSCVTTKIDFPDTDQEMSIINVADGELDSKFYSAEKLKQMNVLVIDTKNTERSISMVDKLSSDLVRYGNKKAAADCDTKLVYEYQNSNLKKIFKTVSFEGKTGEIYDLVLLRDCYILPGKVSNDTTGIVLAYQFVYPVDESISIDVKGKFLFRGYLAFEGYGVIPYPAYSCAIQESNKNAVDAVTAKLGEGIELLTLSGSEVKFKVTDAFLKSLTEETTVPTEAVVGVNSIPETNSSKSQSSSSGNCTAIKSSTEKPTSYTSAKFKALLESQ